VIVFPNVPSSGYGKPPIAASSSNAGHSWLPHAFGFSIEFDAILPFLSGGGGAVGINLEWTWDDGLGFYLYKPTSQVSEGFSLGASGQFNVAWGSGSWSGNSEGISGSIGNFTGGYFYSPDPSSGWQGVSLGWGVGPSGPPVGLGFTETYYHPIWIAR
jgi:hypothetical protein